MRIGSRSSGGTRLNLRSVHSSLPSFRSPIFRGCQPFWPSLRIRRRYAASLSGRSNITHQDFHAHVCAPKVLSAVREMFVGTMNLPEFAGVYGWAYELFCSSIGDRLNSNPFVLCRYEWYESLEQFLESRNTPLKFYQLVGNCPIAIPEPDDWACMRFWPHNTIANARTRVGNLNGNIADQDVADAINVFRGWFSLAESQSDSIIVGVHGWSDGEQMRHDNNIHRNAVGPAICKSHERIRFP